jgi:hypothetical protein
MLQADLQQKQNRKVRWQHYKDALDFYEAALDFYQKKMPNILIVDKIINRIQEVKQKIPASSYKKKGNMSNAAISLP